MSTNRNEIVELRGVVTRVHWRCPEGSGNAIFYVDTEVSEEGKGRSVAVIGRLGDLIVEGREVCAVGRWRDHERYGRQFHADGVTFAVPRTKPGVIRFLREVLDMSESLANRIWTRFRERTPEVLRLEPQTLAATGLVGKEEVGKEEAARISATLQQLLRHQEVYLSLSTLFAGRRMPVGLVNACIRRWRADATDVVRRDPYVLMTVPGQTVGFARADSLYLDLGGDPARLKRQALFLAYAIENNREGHTWILAVHLARELAAEMEKRGGATPRAVDAIRLGLRAKLLASRRDSANRLWITTVTMDRNEATVAGQTYSLLAALAPLGGEEHALRIDAA